MFALGFPLLLIPFAIYNMIAFLTPGVAWTSPVTVVRLASGQDWVLTWEDILLAFAVLLLWVETVKSARLGRRGAMEHILAIILFAAMLAEFLLMPQAATSTFFLLMTLACVEVISGFTLVRRSAQRQTNTEGPRPG